MPGWVLPCGEPISTTASSATGGIARRAEQRYLRAMAADGDAGSASGEVAALLGRGATAAG